MKAFLKQRPTGRLLYLYAAIAGAIYPLGLAPLNIWPLLFVSVLVLIALLDNQPTKQAFKIAYCYGVGYFAVGASWVYVSIHDFGHAPVWLSAFLTLVFVLFLALYKGSMGWLVGKAYALKGQMGFYFTFPLAWLALDWFQGVFLTGFPWLYLGYGLVDSVFSGWLSWFGVQGASYFAVILMLLTYLCLQMVRQSSNKGLFKAPLIALSVLWIVWMGSSLLMDKYSSLEPTTEQSVSVALVQPNIPQNEKWQPELLSTFIHRYHNMTEPLWGADLIIWPEAAIPAVKHRVENWLELWSKQAKASGSQLILGIPVYEAEQQQIYASVITLGDYQQRYDKQHLVPFGEFVPLERWLRGLIEFFNLPMSGMTAGRSEQKALETERFNIYPAICYEIAFSGLFDKFNKSVTNQKDSLIVTISNDAWFGRSWGPHQHLQIAQSRALEYGIPVLRATNTGITAVIDHKGQILRKTPQFEQNVLNDRFIFKFASTVYSKYGLIMCLFLVVILQFLIALILLKIQKNK